MAAPVFCSSSLLQTTKWTSKRYESVRKQCWLRGILIAKSRPIVYGMSIRQYCDLLASLLSRHHIWYVNLLPRKKAILDHDGDDLSIFGQNSARRFQISLSMESVNLWFRSTAAKQKRQARERDLPPYYTAFSKGFFHRRNSNSSTSSLSVSSSEDSLPRYCVVAILSTDPFTILEAQNSKA